MAQPQGAEPGRAVPAPDRSLPWRRLWRPGHPLFWLMLALNALGAGCSWALQALPLGGAAAWIVAACALGNAGLGLLVGWRLMRDEADAPR